MIRPYDKAGVHGLLSCTLAGIGADSLVQTPDGDCRAGDLELGQWVTTRRGPRRINHISHHRAAAGQPLILVTPDGLCAGPTTECLFLTGQRVLIHDWRARVLYRRNAATPQVSQLEDGEFVRVTHCPGAALVTLSLGRPEIIYCNGLAVVTADAAPLPHTRGAPIQTTMPLT